MPAIIPITEQYRIELDAYSWQVSRWKNRPSRPEGGNWEGYLWFPTLQLAGEAVLKLSVAREHLEGVDVILEALHRYSRLIATAIAASEHPDRWSEAVKRLESDDA